MSVDDHWTKAKAFPRIIESREFTDEGEVLKE